MSIEPVPADPSSGAIPFETLAEIARGATARVDLCRVLPPHPRAGALVAVKRLHEHLAEDPTFAKEFFDEVWMTASLRHPNVIQVVGWGIDAEGAYFAVELVQGVSLLRLMKTIFDTREAFTERMVVYIASRVCRGLAAAHALTSPDGAPLLLVHRDLTPGNVIVGFAGEVKIADFGTAKAMQRLTKTMTGLRKGAPTYMAPEQARSDVIDARADLFSLGVMLFELFAGRRPWLAKSDYEMAQVTARDPPADLHELRPKIDRELVAIVNRCLEKDPSARFQSANEIGSRLDQWLDLHGYQEDNEEALGRFVRRNAMRQMRWFERAIAGELLPNGAREPPHVPTYAGHTEPRLASGEPTVPDVRRPRAHDEPDEAPPRPTPAPLASRPLVPSRAPTPADPRSIRAANAVEQLKKLAPLGGRPRVGRAGQRPARSTRRRSHDEEGDTTDVAVIDAPSEPRIVDASDDEMIPTLVKKEDDGVRALRAEARAEHAAVQSSDARRSRARVLPPLLARPPIDEDSDERITGVHDNHAAPALSPAMSTPDPSELHASSDDIATVLNATPARAIDPARAVIPPSPDVPPRPFAEDANASRSAARPPKPDARTISADDVQVIHRGPLEQAPATEEAVMAEADRFALESVRCGEEARVAQARAERKAAAAKIASEAAFIASDALQLLHTAGLAAAIKRLEEARAHANAPRASLATIPPQTAHTAGPSTKPVRVGRRSGVTLPEPAPRPEGLVAAILGLPRAVIVTLAVLGLGLVVLMILRSAK